MLKKLIRGGLRKVGFDLHRLLTVSNPAFQLLKGLERFQVDLVFDIGANTGQFASELRRIGYKGQLVSFEPLSVAHRVLKKTAERDPGWIVHEQCAIGDTDGEIEINVAGNSVSSSVLPMLDIHSFAAKGSAYVGSEMVAINRLDSVAPSYLQNSNRYFVKVDTQGYEWQVLDGGRETFAKAQGVLCELSLTPLYEGQRLWMDMLQRLNSEGFTLWSIQKGFTDPRDGRTLQVDAVFFRESFGN
ncbi:FkbM family methyltransferase [Methylomonas methanica]|uniref:Methyltransferase FkbM family n=1 Tax=Methylomonas methanica (strain DSM 25384 / MC09) TaxID=857087 RepID=F9ZWE8_METMM|nr:FkbM family methyltransferase [Methylomonas methanica]AEF99617.1 methyltransferase FkbM family [Methylomonas methanica MC09]